MVRHRRTLDGRTSTRIGRRLSEGRRHQAPMGTRRHRMARPTARLGMDRRMGLRHQEHPMVGHRDLRTPGQSILRQTTMGLLGTHRMAGRMGLLRIMATRPPVPPGAALSRERRHVSPQRHMLSHRLPPQHRQFWATRCASPMCRQS